VAYGATSSPSPSCKGCGALLLGTRALPLLWVVMVWLLVVPGAVGADEKGQEPIHTTTVTQADHQRQSRVCVNHHRGVGFSVLDGETGTRLARVPIGRAPHGIAVSRDGARLFVVNQEDDTVSIIDAHSYQLVQTLSVGKEPMQLVVSPDGASLYVAAKGDGVVEVFDRAHGTRTARIPVGPSPHQLILSHDGRTLFVTVEGEASTAVLETATGQLLRRLAVGLYPKRLAVAPDERSAFLVTHGFNGELQIALPQGDILRRLTLPDDPTTAATPRYLDGGGRELLVRGVGVSPDGHRLLITSNQGPCVLVLALPSGDVLGWIPVCDMPNFVVFPRDSRIAMVSCSGGPGGGGGSGRSTPPPPSRGRVVPGGNGGVS
jgi:YVTN family beta-propeller protein